MSEVVDYQKALDEWLAKQRKRRLVLTDEDVAGGMACKEPEGVFATGGQTKGK